MSQRIIDIAMQFYQTIKLLQQIRNLTPLDLTTVTLLQYSIPKLHYNLSSLKSSFTCRLPVTATCNCCHTTVSTEHSIILSINCLDMNSDEQLQTRKLMYNIA